MNIYKLSTNNLPPGSHYQCHLFETISKRTGTTRPNELFNRFF